MKLFKSMAAFVFLFHSTNILAYSDEYQVYDAVIANVGQYNLMLNNNYTANGLPYPDYPGAILSNHALIGVPEWALGVFDWFEQGLYLPLYSHASNYGFTLNGFKLRELFVKPNAQEQFFFYGLNIEFSGNARQWEPKRITSELRPILGWHFSKLDIIINPIFDTDFTGGFSNLISAPAERVAYKVNQTWVFALEEYAEYGPLGHFYPINQQSHSLWGVFDYYKTWINIEAGVGFGLTKATDKLIFKLMISRNLN